MRKTTSTNSINRRQIETTCGIAYTASLIGGRWKINILVFLLEKEELRYSELRKLMPGISERMLFTQLKELREDGLINRNKLQDSPLVVEYSLTDRGQSLSAVLWAMDEWGEVYRNK